MGLLDKFRLDGKAALITGGGRGIGRGIALAYAEMGADIAIAGRSVEDLERTAERVRAFGHCCIAIPCDVTKQEQVASMVERTLAELGRIDILVNNVGVGWVDQDKYHRSGGKLMLEASVDEWRAVIDTNLISVVSCSKAVVPHMIERGGGKIINISSMAGFSTGVGLSAYAASKAAMNHLTHTMAAEWGQYKINVNCIAPGRIVTEERSQFGIWNQEMQEKVGKATVIGRVGYEDDLNPLAVYLASAASDWMTGSVIVLDGGGQGPAARR